MSNLSAEDLKYNNAVEQYVQLFGYAPNFESLPIVTVEMILDAVKTGKEIYEEESSQDSVEL